MSKPKPRDVYTVELATGGRVIVYARSPKGAISVAKSHGHQVDATSTATIASGSLGKEAINPPDRRAS